MHILSQQEIHEDQWNAILSSVSRDFRGAHARLEILGPGSDYRVETENRQFGGIAADDHDAERVVWIHFVGLDHGVHGATVIRMLTRIGREGPVIQIESRDGAKTILTLASPEAYALCEPADS